MIPLYNNQNENKNPNMNRSF